MPVEVPREEAETHRGHWVDSAGHNRYWVPDDEFPNKPLTITTRGFLLSENKHAVVVAGSIAVDGASGGILTIPKIAVTKGWTAEP